MFLGPFFPNPFSDFFAIISPNHKIGIRNNFCAKIGMRLENCVEAYGSEKAKDKCMNLFYDFYECQHMKIQLLRAKEIQKERRRKYKAGELDKLYSDKPPLESYFHI